MNLHKDIVDMAANQDANQALCGIGTFELESSPVQDQFRLAQSLPKQGQKRWAPKVKTGCLTCRRRRVKCDETKPICRRCLRSTYHCEGYDDAHTSRQPYVIAAQGFVPGVRLPLRSINDKTSSTLLYFMDSTHPGYSVHAWRSSVLGELPRRMGHSATLDASVATFTSLLESLHLPSPFQQPDNTSLQLYITSIKALQKALATPKARYQTSTLCSAYLLAQCHVWMAQNMNISRGHGEGLSHLISVLLLQKPKDPFPLGLSYAVSVELIESAFFNPNIRLLPWIQTHFNMPEREWRTSTLSPASKPSIPPFPLTWYCILPDIIRSPTENIQQIQSIYSSILPLYRQLDLCIAANTKPPYWTIVDTLAVNETQGIYIVFGTILNAFLRAFNPFDTVLFSQKSTFCADAITLGERALQERPLSAHHVPEALLAAWCVADGDTKARLRQLIEDYRHTFAMARLIQNVASWPEAPAQIREISWFTTYNRGEDSYMGSKRVRPMVATNQGLTEYCCIL